LDKDFPMKPEEILSLVSRSFTTCFQLVPTGIWTLWMDS